MPEVRTQAPEVLSALVAALAARTGLADVSVTSGPIGYEQREKLEFWGIEGTEVWATFGAVQGRPTHNDNFTLTGAAWVSVDGAGDEQITEARNRVYDIVGELSDYLRTNPHLFNDRVLSAILSSGDLDQGYTDQKRWAQLEFQIEVKARI